MGEVYRQKGRTIWMLRWYQQGIRITESSGTDDEIEAKRLLRVKEGDIAAGRIPTARAGRCTFREASRLIVDDYTEKERASLSRLEGKLENHILPVLGDLRLNQITNAVVATYRRTRLASRAKKATVNRELAIIKRIFTLARRYNLTTTAPWVEILPEHNARKGFFERTAFDAVLQHLPAYLVGPMTLAYWTGWRVPSEILPLEWTQVDQQHQTIRLEPDTTKNDEGRTFPYRLIDDVVQLVATRVTEADGPYVFHRGGDLIQADGETLYGPWHAACAAAGVKGRIPHDFRRTAVRNLTRTGTSEKVAMTITGHKTRSVFDRYDIVAMTDAETAIARLVAHAGSGEPKKS
jgi:integrase